MPDVPFSKAKILIVDDEPGIRDSLGMLLEGEYEYRECVSGEEALRLLAEDEFAVVLMDVMMPGMGGEEALKAVKASYAETEVIMVTGVTSVEKAVTCMKNGAYDFLTKPWDVAELRSLLKRAVEKWQLTRENHLWRLQQSETSKAPSAILGKSPVMQQLRDRIAKVADYDSTILITGESGTGKELVAASIHWQSGRREGRFVGISCAAIPEDLVESELFGHEKGAFSSAISTRVGKFEYACGGTLFLDDISTLSMQVQAKLLRVLQERSMTRLGSNRVVPVDVRLISSTNQNLEALVKKGLFRQDLYWRISGVPITLPPLRERGNDVVELLDVFIARVCQRYRRPIPKIGKEVYQAVRKHTFPGNVRELANLAETLVVLCTGDEVGISALPLQVLVNATGNEGRFDLPPMEWITMRQAVHEFEKQILERALKASKWNQSIAAKRLGIHRNTVLNKIRELNIDVPT